MGSPDLKTRLLEAFRALTRANEALVFATQELDQAIDELSQKEQTEQSLITSGVKKLLFSEKEALLDKVRASNEARVTPIDISTPPQESE